MTARKTTTGFVNAGSAQLYYEIAGSGRNFVMIHAGVADHRQWNDAFGHFVDSHRVLRYDMRGFSKSEPVEGNYRAIDDLSTVLDTVGIDQPKIMMGCSMGGVLAMDYTLTYPKSVAALIMVCSGPSALKLDIPAPDKFKLVELAEQQGDLERVCELETQIWFDGESRSPEDVDPQQRKLLYEMNYLALQHDTKELGERQKDLQPAAYKRLDEIEVPVLVVVGALDIPYTHAAADFMCENIRDVKRVEIQDAAHLPSMEKPDEFNQIVEEFLHKRVRDAG